MSKELKIPEELHELMLENQSAVACRNYCITLRFGVKRAIKYGKISQKLKIKFWSTVGELYPETSEGDWGYNYKTRVVKKVKEE